MKIKELLAKSKATPELMTASEWTKVRDWKLKQESIAGVPDWPKFNNIRRG